MITENSPSTDPIGFAIDFYQKTNTEAIIEVETTVTEDEELPVSHFFRTFTDFPNQEKEALKRVEGKVLDIGAGAGCHSLYLQNEQIDVHALDISTQACSVMTGLGINKVTCQDIWTYQPKEKYDTLLMLMNGIGMVKDLNGLKLFLLKCKEFLNAGGKILIDSADIIYMYQEEDGSVAIDLNDKYHGEIEYRLRYETADSGWFPWLYVGFEVLQDIATECGYETELLYADKTYSFSAELKLKS